MPPSGVPIMVAALPRASFPASATESWLGCTTLGTAAVEARPLSTVSVPSAKPTTSTCASRSSPASSASTTVEAPTARRASHQIITRLRFQRSTSTPAGSWRSSAGSSTTKPTSPAADAEPVTASTSSG